MAQELKTKLSLIEWCDKQVAEGKELGIGWEGGGDSGWCWFTIDGEKVSDSEENDEITQLLDLMYDELDYGSWAGEFFADGEATYSSEEKAFVGTDYYSEDETVNYKCDIKIRIPKHLWFDRMEISVQNEDADVDAVFHLRNGFLTSAHDAFLEHFKEEFHHEVYQVIERFRNDRDQNEYRSMWENYDLTRSEFTEEGDFLVYELEELGIGSTTSDEKDIYLQLVSLNEEDETE